MTVVLWLYTRSMPPDSRNIAVIGAGPAGLMAAEVLSDGGAAVTIYDAMASAGRKFLMAGRGGLNLTHSEEFETFLTRYGKPAPQLTAAIEAFPPRALREWSEALGQPTFVGSSGRVFPKAMKASPLLRAWLRRLDATGVKFALRHRWTGWDEKGRLRFQTPNGPVVVDIGATVLALGGASWPRLGSDAAWVETLAAKGVTIAPLKPANCGFTVAWSEIFRDRFEGQPLKGIALSFGPRTVRGEAVITRTGIEGGAIYALSAELREAVLASGQATLRIALRPDMDVKALTARLSTPKAKQSFSNWLRKAAQLSPVGIGLLQEAAMICRHIIVVAVSQPNWLNGSTPCRSSSMASRPSPARSRPPAEYRSMNWIPISCSAVCPACSHRAKCSTGKPRPAVICCRPRSPRARQRQEGC